MTGIKTTGEKKLMLFSGRAHPELAEEVARRLAVTLVPTKVYDFANGEIYVRYQESARGADCFLIQSHTAPINKWIMEQLIMIDALKRASAASITVIIPSYGYARQDKKHKGREPISARLVADLLKSAGADRILTVDLHTDQIQGFFDGPVDHLTALPVLADYVGAKVDRTKLTIVSPDAGRVRVADRWCDRLDAPLAIVHKRRDKDVANQVTVHEVVGEVEGRVCVLVDDMIDTGGTICAAADALFAHGAEDVIVTATHGILSGPAGDRLKNSRVSEFVLTDTLPTPNELKLDKITVLSIAPTIARAVHEVFEDGSVTSLFEEQQ
ncbi:ribose-phosphate diphosphokinase [Streptomyces somaliensis]|uniref:Ribose-phosphate pyrophosphokinase n=1 Tax=Streptomyces somaliensis (strain ATCC 33201 / DSM 40738 / JCM 12659 / KCTC 9044 / NCTC 11332 / NRRL B-12077 / IP 733) TaxID=1134445 RepID=A0AA44IDR1_STRE0|nr:ribose-phosphate diphosphokinase [Streptomyces somaliensis]MCP9944092.1 ribose-phosphate diphosphokinase [Streptomyces somaliensis]MCP9962671.1 ribose-phosphate diphosphokinase [Streptomyces somaliensis]MCP9975507.1 ribose-phosphate diphosphokinase [Streptomyces somaliensis]MCQ0023059.1 ribose-phosphate diphosphokinase [Streptomyces somaliensis DSM 40738]NKY14558.1 ribose-phosphate diphosphokinase [Streptomyces somaliensis DSM 40738]